MTTRRLVGSTTYGARLFAYLLGVLVVGGATLGLGLSLAWPDITSVGPLEGTVDDTAEVAGGAVLSVIGVYIIGTGLLGTVNKFVADSVAQGVSMTDLDVEVAVETTEFRVEEPVEVEGTVTAEPAAVDTEEGARTVRQFGPSPATVETDVEPDSDGAVVEPDPDPADDGGTDPIETTEPPEAGTASDGDDDGATDPEPAGPGPAAPAEGDGRAEPPTEGEAGSGAAGGDDAGTAPPATEDEKPPITERETRMGPPPSDDAADATREEPETATADPIETTEPPEAGTEAAESEAGRSDGSESGPVPEVETAFESEGIEPSTEETDDSGEPGEPATGGSTDGPPTEESGADGGSAGRAPTGEGTEPGGRAGSGEPGSPGDEKVPREPSPEEIAFGTTDESDGEPDDVGRGGVPGGGGVEEPESADESVEPAGSSGRDPLADPDEES
jgi:hypothetical protein